MEKVMKSIADITKGKSYCTQKYSFETVGMPEFDYDDDSSKTIAWQHSGETVQTKGYIALTPTLEKIKAADDKPIITYFLDGSRHTYKVDDIAYNKKIYPVIAGQVGVGCCHRINGAMRPDLFYRKLVIALPNVCNADGWNDDAFFSAMTVKLNRESEFLKKLNIEFSAILPYEIPGGKFTSRLENVGIARIQDYMIESEKQMVGELVKAKKLNQDNYLLKDGSLEYKQMMRGDENYRVLDKIKNNYRWVIGVSKSFNPESIMDHSGKPNANYIADLPLYHRTPVARYENKEYLGDVQFGVWYIRLRDKSRTYTPFDGVIKVEKILVGKETEEGLDTEVVDTLSANLINERTPTCYGSDRRWANHLYPVYLTESYVKSKYMSTEMFLYLF